MSYHEVIDNTFIQPALESIGDGVISTNVDGIITFINPPAEKLTNWQNNSAIGKDISQVFRLINIKTREVLESPVIKVVEEKKVIGLKKNTVLLQKDNNYKYISASCSPILDALQCVIGVVIVFRDITAIKSREEQHILEKNNFKIAFEASPNAMIIIDEKGFIKNINKTLKKIFNIRDTNYVNNNLESIISCNSNHEESSCMLYKINNHLEQVFEEGIEVNDLISEYTIKIKENIHTYWFNINIIPMMIDREKSALIVLENITNYIKEKTKLIKARDVCAMMIENFPALVWRSNKTMKYDYVNNRWLQFTGMQFEQTIEFGWLKSIHPNDVENLLKIYKQAYETKTHINTEVRIKNYKSEYRKCLYIGSPFYNMKNEFSGFIGMVIDITKRVESEQSISDSEEKYQHLLNSSVNAVFLYEILEDGYLQLIEVNDNACKQLEYTKEEILNNKEINIFINNDFKQLLSKKNKTILNTYLTSKHGNKIPVQLYINVYSIRNKTFLLYIAKDISEKMQNDINNKKQATNDNTEEFIKDIELNNESVIDFTLSNDKIINKKEYYDSESKINNNKKTFENIKGIQIDDNGEIAYVYETSKTTNYKISYKDLIHMEEDANKLFNIFDIGEEDWTVYYTLTHRIKIRAELMEAWDIKNKAFILELAIRRKDRASIKISLINLIDEIKTYKLVAL